MDGRGEVGREGSAISEAGGTGGQSLPLNPFTKSGAVPTTLW